MTVGDHHGKMENRDEAKIYPIVGIREAGSTNMRMLLDMLNDRNSPFMDASNFIVSREFNFVVD